MKMAGKKGNMKKHWCALGQGIVLAVPPGDTEKMATSLGCEKHRLDPTAKGHKLACMRWDTYEGLTRALKKYEEGRFTLFVF